MSKTKLIIEEPQEIKGQGIMPKMRVWIGHDQYGFFQFKEKPTFEMRGKSSGFFCKNDSGMYLEDMTFPIPFGECAEYEITFREVKQ